MEFPPAVEQWRPYVAMYFPPELIDKALWVIQHESGGDPNNHGDNGVAIGLFQIQDNRNFPERPNEEYLLNPLNNIRYAAEQLGAASGNFGAWGEGTTYQGKPFGALGNHPFPGNDGKVDDPEVIAAFRRYLNYNAKYSKWSESGGAEASPWPFTDEETRQYQADAIIAEQYIKDMTNGAVNADDILQRYKFWNETDPALIDAENSANQYAREIDTRKMAADMAANMLRESNDMQQKAVADRQGYMTVDRSGTLIRRPGGGLIPQARVPTADELFDKALAKVKAGLPDVKDIPYPTRPPGLLTGTGAGTPGLASAFQSAFGNTTTGPSPRPAQGGRGLVDESGNTVEGYDPRAQMSQYRTPSRTSSILTKVPSQLPISFQSLGVKTGPASYPIPTFEQLGIKTGGYNREEDQNLPFYLRGKRNSGSFFSRLTGSLFGGFR